jgi:hypothetical protein
MARLHNDLFTICDRNRDGSFATQSNRRSILRQFADDLARAGFNIRQMKAQDLKGRHVGALLRRWQSEGLAISTIKNRMAVLRWWAEKVGNPGAVKSNEDLGIEKREYTTNENKSASIQTVDLSKMDERIAASLVLQSEFGLRREEAMKFQPEYALSGRSPLDPETKEIRLKGSWTKGGRDRVIPIKTQAQREALLKAAYLARSGSMIPPDRSYRQHLIIWEKETASQGIGRTHGLRHAYAQRRYMELTGWAAPAVAGIRKLTPDERQKDKEARKIISEELGHGRIAITNAYLGSWKGGK